MNLLELNTKVLLKFLREYNHKQDYSLRTCRNPSELFEIRRGMFQTISKVKKAFEEEKIAIEVFSLGIMNVDWCLEILFYLAINDLINDAQYFKSKQNKQEFLKDLIEDLVKYYFSSEESDFVNGLRRHMAATLCSLYGEEDRSNCEGEDFVLSLFARSFSVRLALDDVPANRSIPLLEENLECAKVDQLAAAIILNCLRDMGRTSQNALTSADHYSPRTGTTCARFFARATSLIPESSLSSQILNFLKRCTASTNVNWNNLATVLHCSLQTNPSFHKPIIYGLIEFSLQHSSCWHLYAVFVLGRICSLKSCCLNMTYLQWFSSTFSSDSQRPLDTDDKARFFLKAMGDILCSDPAAFTKVHIHKVASVPSTCQTDLGEYIQIARTFLISINESTELGFFESVDDCSSSENDIVCLINYYRTNKKLPQHFLSSINFRRQYFDREFLPKLMSSCPGVSSDHHSILKQLAGMGKISASMISKHIEQCSQKQRN